MGIASDEALLAGMAAGDHDAARAFVRRHQQRVYGLAAGVVADRDAAQDVAQEAFVRIWRHAGAFDPRRGSVAGWVLTITRNAAIDAVRLRRATLADPETMLALMGPAAGPGPDDRAVFAEELDRVRWALATLPPNQRHAVLLAAFFGLTAVEIAEREGIPLGTAKTRVRDGLRRLRDRLAEGVSP